VSISPDSIRFDKAYSVYLEIAENRKETAEIRNGKEATK
jgi:hypothetical protein